MILRKYLNVGNHSVSFTIHEWLMLSSAFSGLLLLFRMIITGSATYLFLPWNLFLAFIPYWISSWISTSESIRKNKIERVLVLAAWLLFIPNSFYIITDLFHLTRVKSAPQWFDLLMIFSFAWNGLLCGILSLRRIENFISSITGKKIPVLFIFAVVWLSAFGIYIGRYLRFNSWDIITDPFSLVGEIINMVIHPFQNAYAWGMTVCYSIFMVLIYYTIRKLGESLRT